MRVNLRFIISQEPYEKRPLFHSVGTVFGICLVALPMRADTFTYDGTAQSFTAATAGVYDILAYGAQGGAGAGYKTNGGLGAEMGGDIYLSAGEMLTIDVGGAGGTGHSGQMDYVGGGGGTFVVTSDGTLLIAAGGGGGGGFYDGSGTNALTGTSGANGNPSELGVPGGGLGGAGGTNGSGGSSGGADDSGGGSYLDASFYNTTEISGVTSPDGTNNGYVSITEAPAVTPEPPSLTLLALGLLGLPLALKLRRSV